MTQFELNVPKRYSTFDDGEDEKKTEKGSRLFFLHEMLCSNIILSEHVKQKGKRIRAVLAAVRVFHSATTTTTTTG